MTSHHSSCPLAPREEQPLRNRRCPARSPEKSLQLCQKQFLPRSGRATLRRRGVSLIEMVTVMGLVGALLTLTATTLHRVLRTEAVARAANARLAAVQRSASMFRADIHAAASVTVADDGRRLTLQWPDQSQVEYVVEPQSLRRTKTVGDGTLHREDFFLHEATVNLHHDEPDGRTVYTLLWELPPTGVLPAHGAEPTRVPIPIEASPRRRPTTEGGTE
jgi:type II secretory pathway pseudopilin PulG